MSITLAAGRHTEAVRHTPLAVQLPQGSQLPVAEDKRQQKARTINLTDGQTGANDQGRRCCNVYGEHQNNSQ
eukprot:49112-Eustigmatos_ZCMA.PRE.1